VAWFIYFTAECHSANCNLQSAILQCCANKRSVECHSADFCSVECHFN